MLFTNRELIQRNIPEALDELQALKNDYPQLVDDEVQLHFDFNDSRVQYYFYSNYPEAIECNLRAIERFAGTPYRSALGYHYWHAGHCYAITGEHQLAETYLNEAMEFAGEEELEHNFLRVDSLISHAMNYETRERGTPTSRDYLLQALDHIKSRGLREPIREAAIVNGLGNYYLNSGDQREGLKYFENSARIYEQHYDLANMANVYSNMGLCYLELNELKEAERLLYKSLELRTQFSPPDELSISYHNLAIVYRQMNDLNKCYDMLLKCREVLKGTGSKVNIDTTEMMIGDIEALLASSASR